MLRFPEKMNSVTDHLCFFHFREKSVDFLPAPHKLTSKITASHERVFTSKPDINLLSPGRNLDKWCNTLVQVVRRVESGKSGGYSQQTVTTNLIYLFSVVSRWPSCDPILEELMLNHVLNDITVKPALWWWYYSRVIYCIYFIYVLILVYLNIFVIFICNSLLLLFWFIIVLKC